MRKPSGRKKIIISIFILIIVGAPAFAAYLLLPGKQSNSESEAAISAMEQVIPYFGAENTISGLGRDPLAVMSINGVDIVGGLEIPSINLRAPVAESGTEKEFFATRESGSPVKGNLVIIGGRHDVFSRITRGKPGEKVMFTDVDGIRYEYRITTQFHKKDWDEADYDLMLCYRTDKNTMFVLACTKE